MASIRLEPPKPFNFKQPDDWPKWKCRFEQYGITSGLANEGEVCQVSTLLYCMADEARCVLSSTNISEEDRKKYDAMIARLKDSFQVRRNVIY